MSDGIIQKLTEIFEKFPGIGPRQAKRFVYSLIKEDESFIKEFLKLVSELKTRVKICEKCFRIFEEGAPLYSSKKLCPVCNDSGRDASKLLLVEKDTDFENIEKSGVYKGLYFVLGGVVSPLDPSSQKKLRLKNLFSRAEKEAGKTLKELIIATSATREGDTTALYIQRILEPFSKKGAIKITRLGKGLQTGAELEYSDMETLKHALLNRSELK